MKNIIIIINIVVYIDIDFIFIDCSWYDILII